MTRRQYAGAAIVIAALAAGAFLRLDALGEPSYWLDEILHQQITSDAAKLPWWRWLGTLHAEHAGLYYLTQLATRLIGTSEFAGRFAAALLGIATIPLAWLVTRRTSGGVIAAILIAVSPLHVYFSREARSYALLTFLAAALMLVLLHARSRTAAALLLVGTLYTSAVAAPIVIAAFLVCVACAFWVREERRWYATVAAFCAITLALFRVVYAARPVEDANWPGFPDVNAQFFASLVRTFSVSALGTAIQGRTAIAMLIFAIAGLLVLARGARRDAIVIAGMTLLPLTISLAVLKTLDHFYAARYVMPAVFGYCVLAGIGVVAITRWLPVALALSVVTAMQMWPQARSEPFLKLDWRAVAEMIATHAKPGDWVMAAEPWSDVSLRWYLSQKPNPPRMVLMPHVELAERYRTAEKIWFVSAGYDDSEMRRWLCSVPMIAASSLENLRVHYTGDFPRERALPPELRALSVAYGTRGFTLRDDEFNGEGWALPEGGFRWGVGARATIDVPRWEARDRVVRAQLLPFAHPSLPPQRVQLVVNGARAGEWTLTNEWREYSMPVSARFWRNGFNTIAFEFARATPPSQFGGHDTRPLAVSFDWVAINDAGAPRTNEGAPRVSLTRSGALIDERSSWRRGETRLDLARLQREPTLELLGRLGVDPEATWPRVQRGELRLEQLAARIAYGQDCVDDETFLRSAATILLERNPNEDERADLARRKSRVEFLERMVRGINFETKYLH